MQEGHIFTDLSGDKEWIAFYNDPNERDGHSFVAKMCFPNELKDIEEKDVKHLRKDLRQLAKSAKFCFNYNGSAPTMASQCNIGLEFATEIYNSYFEKFSGIKNYFVYRKREWWEKGYIQISHVSGLKYYIHDHKILRGIAERQANTFNFWDIYKQAKSSENLVTNLPSQVLYKIAKSFSEGESIEYMVGEHEYFVSRGNKAIRKTIYINEESIYVNVMKYLWKRRSSIDNNCCNYESQGTAALMTKIGAIRYFNHLVNDGLIFKVLIPNDVHDELLVESPKEIAEQEAKILSECMEYSANLLCKKVSISAVPEIGEYWLH